MVFPFAGGDRQRQDEPALREGARPVDGALQVRRGAQPQGAHPGERGREGIGSGKDGINL